MGNRFVKNFQENSPNTRGTMTGIVYHRAQEVFASKMASDSGLLPSYLFDSHFLLPNYEGAVPHAHYSN